jgi:hypothetical protein
MYFIITKYILCRGHYGKQFQAGFRQFPAGAGFLARPCKFRHNGSTLFIQHHFMFETARPEGWPPALRQKTIAGKSLFIKEARDFPFEHKIG